MLQSRQRRECRPSSGAARLEQPPAAPSSWHHDIVVRRDAGTRTHSREDEVLKDLLVNLLEGARARALLLDARAAGRLAHHAALADEDDVAVRELLLELAGKAARTGEGASARLEREREGGGRGTDRPWILWKALTWGTGTKTTMAFLPPLTSTSRAAEIWRGRSSALRSGTLFSRSRRAWATRVSVASGAVRGALAVLKICVCAVCGQHAALVEAAGREGGRGDGPWR